MKIKKYANLIILLLAALLSRIIFIDKYKVIIWDAAVYLMNAKWFAGEQVFWEVLRAPLFPFMLSFFVRIGIESFLFFKIVSILISVVSIMVAYFVAREFFGEKAGLLSGFILICVPLHLLWSVAIYTEILSSIFILAALFFTWKGLKNEKMLYVAAFICGLATLTRYPVGVIFPAILLFLLLQKKLNVKKFAFMFLVFMLTVSPWLIYNQVNFADPLHSVKEGIRWQGPVPEPVYYYIFELPPALSFSVLVIAFGFIVSIKNYKQPKFQLLLLFLIVFFIAMSALSHKEIRYFLPAIPVLVVFASYFAEKISWKKWFLPMAILLILTFITAIPNYDDCDGLINASSGLDGVVASTYWPHAAYYSNVPVRAMPEVTDNFSLFLAEANISYVLTSSLGGWPPYAADFEFFDNHESLELVKEVTDNCQTYKVYKVIS